MTNEQDVYPEHRASLLNRTACGLAEVVGVQAYQLPAAFIEQSALAVSRILRHTPHDIAQALGNAEAAQRTIEALGARARAQLTYSEHIIVESVKALRAIVRADGAIRVGAERTLAAWHGLVTAPDGTVANLKTEIDRLEQARELNEKVDNGEALTIGEMMILARDKVLAEARADGARRVNVERTAETWYGGNGPIRVEKSLTPSEIEARSLMLAQAQLIDAPIERDHHGREYPLRDSDGNYLGVDENTI